MLRCVVKTTKALANIALRAFHNITRLARHFSFCLQARRSVGRFAASLVNCVHFYETHKLLPGHVNK